MVSELEYEIAKKLVSYHTSTDVNTLKWLMENPDIYELIKGLVLRFMDKTYKHLM